MLVRRVVVVVLSGAVLLALAAPTVARPNNESPIIVPGVWGTELALLTQGFVAADVSYRIGGTQDVVVEYDGGGPNEPLEAIEQIEETVWANEQFRFDHLVIQDGSEAPIAVSYADLEAAIGPRQPGFGKYPLAAVVAAAGIPALGGDRDEYTDAAEQLRDVITAIGVAVLLTVLAFGLVGFLRTRRRVPDAREDRLFA